VWIVARTDDELSNVGEGEQQHEPECSAIIARVSCMDRGTSESKRGQKTSDRANAQSTRPKADERGRAQQQARHGGEILFSTEPLGKPEHTHRSIHIAIRQNVEDVSSHPEGTSGKRCPYRWHRLARVTFVREYRE
jgi:hypothetical protein